MCRGEVWGCAPLSRASSFFSLWVPPPTMPWSLSITPPLLPLLLVEDWGLEVSMVWTGVFFSELVSLLTKSILVVVVFLVACVGCRLCWCAGVGRIEMIVGKGLSRSVEKIYKQDVCCPELERE